MVDVLTVELVRAARNMMGNVSCNALGAGGAVLPVSVTDLCDTCEALRIKRNAALARAEKAERDHVECLHAGASALLRAEQAERERDEARVLYCRKVAERGWESAREVCERVWPDAADALFPVEVKP